MAFSPTWFRFRKSRVPHRPERPMNSGSSTVRKIFIVDDDAGLVRLVEKSLRREGLATASASSGQGAITWLKSGFAELMLLDLKLPDIDGKDLIHQLSESGRHLPFIVITGQGDERVAVEMMKRGALDYLVKDVHFIEFLPAVVRRALSQLEKDARLAQAEEQARQLEKEILEVSENEQRRIGRDLHDGLGQNLTALELLSQALVGKLKLAAPGLVQPAQEITRQIRATIKQTRLLSHNLSPVPLEAEGLMLALSELAAGTEAIGGVKCEFHCPDPVLLSDPTTATHLYRIAQEAVNNSLKHAGPKNIRISLRQANGEWTLSLEDDGRGLEKVSNQKTGSGLHIMKYRAKLIGATLGIHSTPQQGVQITCSSKHKE